MAIHGGDSLGLDVILLGNDSKEYMATLDPPLTRNYPPLIILRTPFGDRYFLHIPDKFGNYKETDGVLVNKITGVIETI